MVDIVHLDFETRSELSVADVGSHRYAEHDSTHPLCFCFSVNDGAVRSLTLPLFEDDWTSDHVHLAELAGNDAVQFMAHNAQFERCIWQECMVPAGFPEIPLYRWHCTAAMASQDALPRKLEKGAKELGLGVEKDMAGHNVMMRLTKPRKPSKNNKDPYVSDPEKFETLIKYCKQDVVVEKAICGHVDALSSRERMVWMLDQKINDRGVFLDLELAQKAQEIYEETVAGYHERMNEITEGEISKCTQRDRFRDWLNRQGVSVDNVQGATLDDLLKSGALEPNVQEAIEIYRKAGKTSLAKYAAALRTVCDDGRARGLHMYYAASTGRFGGRLIQTQNLPRGVLSSGEALEEVVAAVKQKDLETIRKHGELTTVLSSAIRGLFISPPGRDLMVCDYSGIEARVLGWLADDYTLMQNFREGVDVYVDMACTIYNKKHADITKDDRLLGKIAILGLGYQMGVGTFLASCEGYGVEISDDLAQMVVDAYRDKFKDTIKALWADAENAAIAAVQNEGNVYPCAEGKIHYVKKGRFLYAIMPSGDFIAYFKPHLEMKMMPWGKEKLSLFYYGESQSSITSTGAKGGWGKQSTYGGKLVENFTQRIARDVLTSALENLEKSEHYDPIFHVHDEVISEVDEGVGSEEEYAALMLNVPPWARDIPLDAEAWRGKRYRK